MNISRKSKICIFFIVFLSCSMLIEIVFSDYFVPEFLSLSWQDVRRCSRDFYLAFLASSPVAFSYFR